MENLPGENPYEAPERASIAAPPETGSSGYAFQAPSTLTAWVRMLLVAGVVLHGIALVSGYLEWKLLDDAANGIEVTEESAESNDTRQVLVGGLQMLLYFTTAIFFLTWVYRANANAQALGATNIEISPGWSVGWYFIPIACLWKPFQAMNQIWVGLQFEGDDEHRLPGAALGLWWTLWIVSGLLGHAAFRISLSAEELPALTASTITYLVADSLDAVLCLVALWLVSGIHRMQIARREAIQAET